MASGRNSNRSLRTGYLGRSDLGRGPDTSAILPRPYRAPCCPCSLSGQDRSPGPQTSHDPSRPRALPSQPPRPDLSPRTFSGRSSYAPFFIAVAVPGSEAEDEPGEIPRVAGVPVNLFAAGVMSGLSALGYLLARVADRASPRTFPQPAPHPPPRPRRNA